MSYDMVIAAGQTSTWVEKVGAHATCAEGEENAVHIRLAANSRLTHYRLLGQQQVAEFFDDQLTVEIGPGALYEQHLLAAPQGPIRSSQAIHLHGQGARATLGAACAALPQSQLDLDIMLVHEADDTVSDQRVHVLALDHGKVTAQVESQVPPGRHRVSANQLLRALQASGKASVTLRPRLSILSDDVICRHGATTSALRDDELHYLRTRGIARDEAVAMLSEAFLRQVLPAERGALPNELAQMLDEVLALALQRPLEAVHETR